MAAVVQGKHVAARVWQDRTSGGLRIIRGRRSGGHARDGVVLRSAGDSFELCATALVKVDPRAGDQMDHTFMGTVRL